MMKKWITFLLVLSMVLSMTVVTSSAVSPDFGEVTVNLDRKFVFEKAMKGYGMMVGGVQTDDGGGGNIDPSNPWIFEVIIVKDGSRFTVDGSYNANCKFIAHEVDGLENGAVMFNKDTQKYRTVTSGRVDDMFNPSGLSAIEGIWFVDGGMYGSPYWIILESQMMQFPLVLTEGPEEPVQKSVFQSTAEVTEVSIADMDYDNFTVTVTNNTAANDTSLFALMVVSDIVTVTPFSSEVPAYSARDYEFTVMGHAGNANELNTVITNPEKIMDMYIVKFESVDEYTEFFGTIPVEAVSFQSVQNANEGNIQLCNSTSGNRWLKSMGLSRKDSPTVYPGDDHSVCVTLDIN